MKTAQQLRSLSWNRMRAQCVTVSRVRSYEKSFTFMKTALHL